MTLVRQDLEAVECSNPECDGLHPVVLYAKCHPEGGLTVRYDKSHGVLVLVCYECSTAIAEIEVASAPLQ